jgi:hypothetical protein
MQRPNHQQQPTVVADIQNLLRELHQLASHSKPADSHRRDGGSIDNSQDMVIRGK